MKRKCACLACPRPAENMLKDPDTGAEEWFCEMDRDYILELYSDRAARIAARAAAKPGREAADMGREARGKAKASPDARVAKDEADSF